jgi:hypothetical protein
MVKPHSICVIESAVRVIFLHVSYMYCQWLVAGGVIATTTGAAGFGVSAFLQDMNRIAETRIMLSDFIL